MGGWCWFSGVGELVLTEWCCVESGCRININFGKKVKNKSLERFGSKKKTKYELQNYKINYKNIKTFIFLTGAISFIREVVAVIGGVTSPLHRYAPLIGAFELTCLTF